MVEQNSTAAAGKAPPPPPPPPPPPGQRTAGSGIVRTAIHQPGQSAAARQATLTLPLKIDVSNDEEQAFSVENTKRDKKPFTYFAGGQTPDLSDRPSPGFIKKTQPLTAGPPVPRVLPIVPDLQRLEPQAQSQVQPPTQQYDSRDMAAPTLTHQQYNSPMALYSKQNIQEVMQQSAQGPRPFHADAGKGFDMARSQTYQLVHEQEHTSPRQSARYEESSGSEYPRYKGYVDANLQSPSFRRLQYMTGVEPENETETKVVAHQPAYVGGSAEETSDYDHPLDAQFSQKIAEAERPKVPVQAPPQWTRAAQATHAKWERSQESRAQQETMSHPATSPQRGYQYQQYSTQVGSPVQAPVSQVRSPVTKPYQDQPVGYYSQRSKEHWLKPYVAQNVTTFKTTAPPVPLKGRTVMGYQETAVTKKPLEFGTYYGSEGRPTVHKADTLPRTYRQTEAAVGYMPTKEVTISSLVSGEAEKPAYLEEEVPPWHKHAEYKRTVWEKQRTVIDPDQQQKPVIPGEQPSWTQKAAEKQTSWQAYGSNIDPSTHRPAPPVSGGPQWTKRAEKTHSLWQHEADAWAQKRQMEEELRNRGYSSTGHKTTTVTSGERSVPITASQTSRAETTAGGTFYSETTSPPWRQKKVPHETSSGTGGARQDMSIAVGPAETPTGETKSTTSGSFVDNEGHTVNYVKEAYTTVDPGKEFSMLTEEQRKVMEEPLEPGVVSRHVTTKYYKKATYTSTSTTTSTDAPPLITQSPVRAAVENSPAGQVGAGVTQF